MSSNLERNSALSRLCEEILASNECIFFVASINKNGRAIESHFRNDRIITKMSKPELEMFFMQRTMQTSLSKEFDDIVGPLNFITVHRETFLELLFPFSEGSLLVACHLDIIPSYLAKKILFILRDFDWKLKESLYV